MNKVQNFGKSHSIFFPDGLIENGMSIKKLLKNLIIFIKTLKLLFFFVTEHYSDKLN